MATRRNCEVFCSDAQGRDSRKGDESREELLAACLGYEGFHFADGLGEADED